MSDTATSGAPMTSPGMPEARKLTLVPLIAATYFIVSGGPFGLEDIVLRSGYRGAILILLATPLLWAVPTALMVSELASAVPQEGGYYTWVLRALGRFWGFQEAWLSLIGSVFDMAIYPTLFVAYLGHMLPAVYAGARAMWIGVAFVALSAVWNLLGARAVGRSSVLLGAVLLAPFAALAVYAALSRAGAGSPASAAPRFDFLAGIMVAMWNFMGWDNASTVAGEVARPQRTYPLAMAGAAVLVTLSYILPIAAVASTGLPSSAWSTGGWAEVARRVLPAGLMATILATAITAAGMISAAGTQNALTMALSRLPAVMAEDGFLPRVFARRTRRSGAPWVAILACATAWALCLQLPFVKLVMLDVLLTGLSILLEFAALVALRLREPNLARPYRVPGGLTGTIGIGIPPAFLIVVAAVRNHAEPVGPINALELGALLVSAGVAIYFLFGRRSRKGALLR
jgi:amino acid transporter